MASNNSCDPAGCCWGSWRDDGCEGTNRVFSSIVWNAADWEKACTSTPVGQICPNTSRGALPIGADIDKMRIQSPADCVKSTNMWGKIRIPDLQCGLPPPVYKPTSCFTSSTGPYGKYRSDLVGKGWIPSNTSFGLIALNWVPNTGTGWTMITGDAGGIMQTIEHVVPAKYPAKLDNRYLFVADQGLCPTKSVGFLRYGDFVHIRSVNTNQYIRCASATCSLTSDQGTCAQNDWHTFVIKSFNNMKKDGDEVCFGDEIQIQQTVGTHANVTAAGGGAVWACDDSQCNFNYRLRIVPDSGSIYEDPTTEMKSYDNKRQQLSCEQNKLQWSCISNNPLARTLFIVIIVAIASFALSQLITAIRPQRK